MIRSLDIHAWCLLCPIYLFIVILYTILNPDGDIIILLCNSGRSWHLFLWDIISSNSNNSFCSFWHHWCLIVMALLFKHSFSSLASLIVRGFSHNKFQLFFLFISSWVLSTMHDNGLEEFNFASCFQVIALGHVEDCLKCSSGWASSSTSLPVIFCLVFYL